MANITDVEDNFFTISSETYADNLSASISSLEETVPVNSAANYDDGDSVVLVVEPGTTNEAVFTGIKASSPDRYTNCEWTEGNLGVGHAAGATIVDYVTATHHNMMTKGIKKFANSDGSLKQDPVRAALGLTDSASAGWEISPHTYQVASGYNKGNRSFELIGLNANLTTELSPGMRFKVTRDVAAPTQCADLETSSSQYASKTSPTGITFTDDFTCEAWINLESYALGTIVSRFNGTSGFQFVVQADGTLLLGGYNASSANYKRRTTYQSIPLNKWVHVAANLDMSSSTGVIYIDGVAVPALQETGGTNPTALVQAGDLVVGARSGGSIFFDGKIQDVRVWSTVRTELEIRNNMYQQLVGDELGLVAYYKLNGDFNDSTSNANNLTTSGGAGFTTDSAMKLTEFAIITKVEFSSPNTLVTVFTPSGYGIPNMALNSPFYSTQKNPFGFPSNKEDWKIQVLMLVQINRSYASGTGVYYKQGVPLLVPIGSWDFEFHAELGNTSSTSAGWDLRWALAPLSTDTASSANVQPRPKTMMGRYSMPWTGNYIEVPAFGSGSEVVNSAVDYNIYSMVAAGGTLAGGLRGVVGSQITAECAYL